MVAFDGGWMAAPVLMAENQRHRSSCCLVMPVGPMAPPAEAEEGRRASPVLTRLVPLLFFETILGLLLKRLCIFFFHRCCWSVLSQSHVVEERPRAVQEPVHVVLNFEAGVALW